MFIHLDAEITEDGQLRVHLPEDLPPGKVKLAIEYASELQDWSEAEIQQLLAIEPMTGEEIVAGGYSGGWQDLNITDSQKWVAEQRSIRKEQRS